MYPFHLEIYHGKTPDDPPAVDPGRSQSSMIREAVEQIRRDGCHTSQSAEAEHGPSKRKAYPGEVVFQRLAEDHQPRRADKSRWIDGS